ncbi:MAG: hypothetical protein J6W75_02360 [Bacteroidaceae bacterium]|nr:hypothetical protein [Bacteroidaceae bacterium]
MTYNLKATRILFILSLLVPSLIALAFEEGWLDSGMLAGETVSAYTLEILGVALGIICIPLALKLMHFTYIRKDVQGNPQKYLVWSFVRIGLLETSLLYNLLMYYLLEFDVTCGYLALMSAVAFLFVWPSRGRMDNECQLSYEQDEA